jgi:hypothetical protein
MMEYFHFRKINQGDLDGLIRLLYQANTGELPSLPRTDPPRIHNLHQFTSPRFLDVPESQISLTSPVTTTHCLVRMPPLPVLTSRYTEPGRLPGPPTRP